MENYKDELQEVRFKQECLLEKDSFNNPAFRENLESLAQVIQNLIIIEKGTYPNQPNLGVGIGNYLFEILDNTTLLNLQSEIDTQIATFIDHPYITVTTTAKKIEDSNKVKTNTLGIFITIINTINNASVRIDYLFAGSVKTKKIVSTLSYS